MIPTLTFEVFESGPRFLKASFVPHAQEFSYPIARDGLSTIK